MDDSAFIQEINDLVGQILAAETNDFSKLAELAGLDVKNDFVGADLSGTDLSGVDLRWANLSEVDLSGAILDGADLMRADLSGANLNRANLSGADLGGADLNRDNLSRASIDEDTQLDYKWRLVWQLLNTSHSDWRLKNEDLSGAFLQSVNLVNANLIQANLSNADLQYADLRSADLIAANLEKANFWGSRLDGVDFQQANVNQTYFGNNSGMTLRLKQDLIARGAIFDPEEGTPVDALVPV